MWSFYAEIRRKTTLAFPGRFCYNLCTWFCFCDNGKGVIMTKEQFMEQVTHQVRRECASPDLEISCGTFMKNNDTRRYGIVLKKRDEFISPTVYVDGFYQDFKRKKKTIPEVAKEVLEVLERVKTHAMHYQEFSIDFDDCRGYIVYRLISYERNKLFLQTVPHLPFLDLAIVFSVICRISESGLETITVTNELMEKWQTDTKELVRLAEKNTPELLPLTMDSLASVLTRLMGCSDDRETMAAPDMEQPMILLSNASGVNGASVMLYPGVIEQMAVQYDSDLYILPSSIHELIVVPGDGAGTREELSEMVRDINENHVSREEVLSDTAYYYDRTKKRFLYN